MDRRALANHPVLGLTEARVRGALATLEHIGFLKRLDPVGSKHRRTTDGALWRKVVPYQIGFDYLPDFVEANRRAARTRQHRCPLPSQPTQVTAPMRLGASSPKNKPSEANVFMGQLTRHLPPSLPTVEPSDPLAAALARLGAAIGKAHGYSPSG